MDLLGAKGQLDLHYNSTQNYKAKWQFLQTEARKTKQSHTAEE